MALTSSTQTITTTWVLKIADTVDPWTMSNIGKVDIHCKFSASQPTVETGFIIKVGEGMTSGSHGVGKLWMRTLLYPSIAEVAV